MSTKCRPNQGTDSELDSGSDSEKRFEEIHGFREIGQKLVYRQLYDGSERGSAAAAAGTPGGGNYNGEFSKKFEKAGKERKYGLVPTRTGKSIIQADFRTTWCGCEPSATEPILGWLTPRKQQRRGLRPRIRKMSERGAEKHKYSERRSITMASAGGTEKPAQCVCRILIWGGRPGHATELKWCRVEQASLNAFDLAQRKRMQRTH
ncbi:hypothetical protein B0H11DRAFT_1932272 [Mycena galericulata]|nr:hypothetical protein B0H11DRAFT_1932272 [Mycena galericulata]